MRHNSVKLTEGPNVIAQTKQPNTAGQKK